MDSTTETRMLETTDERIYRICGRTNKQTETPMPTPTPAIVPIDHRQEIVDGVLARVRAHFAVKDTYADALVTRLDTALERAQRLALRNDAALGTGATK